MRCAEFIQVYLLFLGVPTWPLLGVRDEREGSDWEGLLEEGEGDLCLTTARIMLITALLDRIIGEEGGEGVFLLKINPCLSDWLCCSSTNPVLFFWPHISYILFLWLRLRFLYGLINFSLIIRYFLSSFSALHSWFGDCILKVMHCPFVPCHSGTYEVLSTGTKHRLSCFTVVTYGQFLRFCLPLSSWLWLACTSPCLFV